MSSLVQTPINIALFRSLIALTRLLRLEWGAVWEATAEHRLSNDVIECPSPSSSHWIFVYANPLRSPRRMWNPKMELHTNFNIIIHKYMCLLQVNGRSHPTKTSLGTFFETKRWFIHFMANIYQRNTKNESWPRHYGYVNRIESCVYEAKKVASIGLFVVIVVTIAIVFDVSECQVGQFNYRTSLSSPSENSRSEEVVACFYQILKEIKLNLNSNRCEWYIDIAVARLVQCTM